MEGYEPQESTAHGYYTKPLVMDANALQIRLDTQALQNDIELFLRGKRLVIQQDDSSGKLTTKTIRIGDALANDLGVQGIMTFIGMNVNPHTVQGNYKEEYYFDEVARIRRGLAYIVTQNTNKWGVSPYNRPLIQTSIMNLIKPFMSRLINNKERDSYGQSLVREEKTGIQRESALSGLNPFRKK